MDRGGKPDGGTVSSALSIPSLLSIPDRRTRCRESRSRGGNEIAAVAALLRNDLCFHGRCEEAAPADAAISCRKDSGRLTSWVNDSSEPLALSP